MPLKYIGSPKKGKDTIIFVPGSMISPVVFDEIQIPTNLQKISISWIHSSSPWDINSIGNRLASLIENLKLGKVIIAAYSSGGVIALITTLKIPNLINGLMLSNTGASTKGQGDPNLPQKIKDEWGDEFNKSFLKRCFFGEIPKAYKQELEEYAKNTKQEAMIEASVSLRQIDLTNRLKEIKCPVMIAHGVLDPIRTMEHIEILNKNLPNSTIRKIQAGHTVMLENPKEYNKALNELLAKLNLIKGTK